VYVKKIDRPRSTIRSLSAAVRSTRFQLGLCLLVGLLLPLAFRALYAEPLPIAGNSAAQNSLSAAALAIIIGVLAIRKFSEFPGVIGASYIFPTFAATFGIAVAIILVTRAPYSGVLLSLSFATVLATRFAIGALELREGGSSYYLVPGGEVDRLLRDLDGAPVMLDDPVLPADPHAAIVADLHHDHSPEWERTFATAALNGIGVYHYKQVWEAQTGKVRIEHLSENSLGSLIPSNSYAKLKWLADMALSIAVLPILIIPLAITAFAIRLDSPGSIFFRQERIGYRGRPFRVLKFRTMTEVKAAPGNVDLVDDAITKDDDVRITRLGRFLRQTRIDELPQIYNILRGDMSWIGPRPEARPLSEWYEKEIPFYSYRHIVRPGITGWAQVNQGHVAGISEVHDKLRYDFYYIKNFSMWLDLVVLFKTVLVVIRGSGAK
jgi:lipopolysaccharide/colanic/teichoic acid biosynthesis glycosyltransferase